MFRHLGAAGLFFLAILDSTPLPTFGGPDILIAILAGSHRNPWYEYAAVATAGSLIGAYITFRLARKAGAAYLNSKFGQGSVSAFLKLFQKMGHRRPWWPPPPFLFRSPPAWFSRQRARPTITLGKYLPIVAVCRAARYSAIAIVADLYGRHFIRVHPASGAILGLAAAVRRDRRSA